MVWTFPEGGKRKWGPSPPAALATRGEEDTGEMHSRQTQCGHLSHSTPRWAYIVACRDHSPRPSSIMSDLPAVTFLIRTVLVRLGTMSNLAEGGQK